MQNKKLILQELARLYPDVKTELNFTTPFQLLVATMLSAQTTDRQVNKITEKLFPLHDTPESIANMTSEELEGFVKSCGLYKNKAKNIIETAKILVSQYTSTVPSEFEKLVALPGVGRKTANVVLANAFHIPAFAVDTHVHRVANRLGLAKAENVIKTEEDLKKLIPAEDWNKAHHWLIFHGRRVCQARNPKCDECTLVEQCPYCRKNAKKDSKRRSGKNEK